MKFSTNTGVDYHRYSNYFLIISVILTAFDEDMEHTLPTMRHDTHTQRILDLASQKGMLRPGDLDTIGAPRVVLTRMTASGLLEKAGQGHLPATWQSRLRA